MEPMMYVGALLGIGSGCSNNDHFNAGFFCRSGL